MIYPSVDFVRPILEPHEARLAACFDRAWERLSRNSDRASFEFGRTVAVVMHQFTMQELRAEYAGERGVRLWEEYETIRVQFDRRVTARLKKMDEDGVTRAQPTQAALAFITPLSPLPLPFTGADDFPNQCAVDVGYVLNDLGTRIDDVLVAARDGDAVLWSYSIERSAPSAAAITLLPAAPTPPAPGAIITIPGTGVAAERKKSKD